MKANEILHAINQPKSKYNTAHAATLANIYLLLKEIKSDIVTAEILEETILMFGDIKQQSKQLTLPLEPKYRYNYHYSASFLNIGCELPAIKIQVTTATGIYKFTIPKDNTFCSLILETIGINVQPIEETTQNQAESTLIVESGIIQAIVKASKFAAKDELTTQFRPALTKVLLHIENNAVTVVSTDAHILYRSKPFTCSGRVEGCKILIETENIKSLAKVKVWEDTTELQVFETGISLEKVFLPIDIKNKYPDYKAIIPEYKTSMEFDKKEFTGLVKQVIPTVGKVWNNRIDFHLNGTIAIHAEDKDMDKECNVSMPYLSKTFCDTDIVFNGKILLETLKALPGKTISMQCGGYSNRAVVLSDETMNESLLLMPLYN